MRFRPMIVSIHRWMGLTMTAFLIVVGLTGSLLAFYSELDKSLNPQLYPKLRPYMARLSMAELAERAEEIAPQARVASVYLRERERAEIRVQPKADSDSPGFAELPFDTLLLEPYTGRELARYTWGDIRQGTVNLMPFIYRLHYELALGPFGGWLVGIVALVWTLDCFAGLYLTLPAPSREMGFAAVASAWRRWRGAWRIKWAGGFYRINYDIHRAGGLWLWIALLIFAWSGVYMNLGDTVYAWVTRSLFDYRPSWEVLANRPPASDGPELSWREAEATLRRLSEQQSELYGVKPLEPITLRYWVGKSAYSYQFRSDRDVQDRGGVTEVIADSRSGKLLAFQLPTGMRAGNTISSWLYALHTANFLGLPYRLFVCILGMAVAALAVTGLFIWQKKRRARKERVSRKACHRSIDAEAPHIGRSLPHNG